MDEQDGVLFPDDVSNEEAIDSWDRAAEEFASYFADGEEFYHKHIISPCIIDLLDDIAGKTVLDLACGEGHFARRLAELAKRNVKITGIDASKNMIRIAREKSQQYSDCMSFQVEDASRMTQLQPDSFDVVVCNMALMDIKDYTTAIREIARVLKPKGIFIFSILHPCFMTPGSGWIKIDPERTDPDNKIGWKVDNYHHSFVSSSLIKSMKDKAYYFHHTLEDYFRALRESGFAVADLREPVPSKELIEEDPGHRPDLRMSAFLIVKSVLLGE
ncbi:class I SAM-dependent methyltransferase [Candidatus Poribacteria bacterium]